MVKMVFGRLVWILSLMVAQVLVFNHLFLWNDIVLLPYIYVVIMLSRDVPRSVVLLIGFAVGLIMDVFANTPGLGAASATFLALVQPVVLGWVIPKDAADDFAPSFRSMTVWTYMLYVFLLVLVHRLVFSSLELFSFSSWSDWGIRVGIGTVSTYIVLLVIDALHISRSHKDHA